MRLKRNTLRILRISPHSVRMRENTDQKNSEYGHFSRSDSFERMSEKIFVLSLY